MGTGSAFRLRKLANMLENCIIEPPCSNQEEKKQNKQSNTKKKRIAPQTVKRSTEENNKNTNIDVKKLHKHNENITKNNRKLSQTHTNILNKLSTILPKNHLKSLKTKNID